MAFLILIQEYNLLDLLKLLLNTVELDNIFT